MSGEGDASGPLQVKKSVFEWVVKKEIFSGDEVQISMPFILGLDEQMSWYLQLKPRVQYNDDIYVALFLMPNRIPAVPIHTKYKLGLITEDDKEPISVAINRVFTTSKGLAGYGFHLMNVKSLLAEENKYFKDNQVTFFCDLEVYKSLEVPDSTFNGYLSGMLESTDFSDATLVVGGEELKVHRCVLSSGSPVFRSMFMEKKRSRRFEIDDLAVDGVKGLLKFIYSGEVKDLAEIAQFVLPAAAKYGVERLKALCEQELCDKLKASNVIPILKFADLHTAKQLKAHALAFISVNSVEVVDDPEFWKLNESNQKLFKEVVRAQVKERSGEPSAKRIRIG